MTLCIVGSINQDVIAQVDTLPRPGETVNARATSRLQGGKGANQAVAAARMGATAHMIGCVGDDAAATDLLGELKAAGVDVAGVSTLEREATGRAFIAIDRAGENQIVVDAGANARLTAGHVAAAWPRDARVVLAQLETPVAATRAAFAQGGVYRMLNAAPALPDGAALFARADMLIVNQLELAGYAGLATPPLTPDDAAIARRLLTREGQCAVVTLGVAGAVLVTARDIVFAPAAAVAVVDTTGAGDCFCGALAALIAQGIAAADALALANAAAGLCVQKPGAGPAMPTREEVDAAITANQDIVRNRTRMVPVAQ